MYREGVIPTLGFPLSVYWNITSICNLRCSHCLSRSGKKLPGELTHAEAMRLVDELIENKVFYLYIAGGEPLLRKDLFQVIEKARAAGISVSMATNGTYITPATAARIRDLGLLDLLVSMDGADAATHDAFRKVPGAFDSAMRAIDLILETGIPMSVGTVVCRQTIDQIDDMYQIMVRKGVPVWRLTGICPVGRGHEIYYQTGLSRDHIHRLVDFFTEHNGPGQPVRVSLDDPLPMKIWALEGKSPVPLQKCGAGRAICCVQYDGSVTPCVLFDEPVGNIRDGSLRQVWETAPFFREMRDVNADTLTGKCTTCGKLSKCNGACRAHAWFEYGEITAPDPVCLRPDVPEFVPSQERRSLPVVSFGGRPSSGCGN
jgi:mycofactocin radical SAM maturase